MRDTIVPPTAIAVAFNCLKSEDKTLEYEFDAGHGMPDRVYFRRAQWLAK